MLWVTVIKNMPCAAFTVKDVGVYVNSIMVPQNFIIISALLLCFPWNGKGIKVFTFQDSRPEPGDLSSAILTNAPEGPLPDRFRICSSHTQQQIGTTNTRTIYVLYEDKDHKKPWFSIGFWWYNHAYILFANIRCTYWSDLGEVARAIFLQWIHICVEIDTVHGSLKTSINGGNVTTVENVKELNPVPNLYLRLGVVHEDIILEPQPVQFFGSLANINIFTNAHRENILSSSILDKSYLSWSNTKWNVVGDAVQEKEMNEEILLSDSKVLNFRIPLDWNKIEAAEECWKYGKSIISRPPSEMSETAFENVYGENSEDCKFFWTPFTDKYSEGTFVDEVTNVSIRY